MLGGKSVKTLAVNGKTIWQKITKPEGLLFRSLEDDNSIRLTKVGYPAPIQLECKTNNGSWTDYTVDSIIELDANDKVVFRSKELANNFSTNQNVYYKFQSTKAFECDGSVQYLIDPTGELSAAKCFSHLFDGSKIAKAPKLPATALADNCYSYMFFGCNNLSTTPDLPAENLLNTGTWNYAYMFQNCKALKETGKIDIV